MRSRTGSALRHPADRGKEDGRGAFDRFAERASFLAGSPLFFVVCLALILVWAVGLIAGASSRFEAAAAALMSAVTLILVAALKNAELRADRAIQLKLDAIATSLLDERRGHRGDSEDDLDEAIGVHEQI
jgi:low affinity Fe/Cu permease